VEVSEEAALESRPPIEERGERASEQGKIRKTE
jgi:hypothetical protein